MDAFAHVHAPIFVAAAWGTPPDHPALEAKGL